MAIRTDIYKSALRDYDAVKSTSEAVKNDMKKRLYDENPELGLIDKKINNAGFEAAKKIIKHPDKKQEISDELKKMLAKLNLEKSMAYSRIGITEDYFDKAYRCPKCHDTGFVDGKECTCFRQYLIDKAYGKALLNDSSERETFNNFCLDYYSKTMKAENGLSYYDNMRLVYMSCMKFAECFESEHSNILLMGKTGLGKTFLCNSITRYVLERGYTVIYISAGRLFKTLQEEQFNNSDEAEMSSFYDDLITVDLLIIDDLGTEFPTVLTGSQIFNILNERIVGERSTVISTNMMLDGIKTQYSDRVLSRLTESFEFLTLYGEDIRIKKKLIEQ